MDWTRRSAGNASARQIPRLVTVILAVAGAVVLALADAGCGHVASNNIAASGNSGSSCATQGVGGDTLPPPCAAPAGTHTGGTNGSAGPALGSTSSQPVAALPPPTPKKGIANPEAPTAAQPTTVGPAGSATSSTVPSPQVTGISPASGNSAGGDSVTITGSGFTDATAVDFGGIGAVMQVNSDTQIIATSPPGSGIVDVTVVAPGGMSATSPADLFSYQG